MIGSVAIVQFVFVGLSWRLGLTFAIYFQSAVAGSAFIGISGAALVRWGGSNSILRYVGYALAVVGVPAFWLYAAATTTAFALLRMSLRFGIRLLSGEGRLRALVFGTGVVLLFGGMTAQFVATF